MSYALTVVLCMSGVVDRVGGQDGTAGQRDAGQARHGAQAGGTAEGRSVSLSTACHHGYEHRD